MTHIIKSVWWGHTERNSYVAATKYQHSISAFLIGLHIHASFINRERWNRVYGKRQTLIRVYDFLKNKNGYIDGNRCKTILTFHANAKLLNFTENLKTASGKCRINVVT